jgi:hypothetical protein
MNTRTFVLASASLAMLATPVAAGRSTTAERETTRQLNLEAARQVQNGNQDRSSNPQFAVADASANLPADSPPAAAPTTSVESASIANPDGAAPAILSSVQSPPSKISTANVLDASGQTIGAVQRVEVTPNGMPTKLAVALTGREGKVTVLDADKVKYDPVKNEILAQQSGAEIRSQATGKTG